MTFYLNRKKWDHYRTLLLIFYRYLISYQIQYALPKVVILCLIVFCSLSPSVIFSQALPDSSIYKKALTTIVNSEEYIIQSKRADFRLVKFNTKNSEQSVSISSVTKDGRKKKLLLFWQKDSEGKWTYLSYVFTSAYKFIDIDKNGIQEIECIDKKADKKRRDINYKLISLNEGDQVVMYSYHQFEYFNVSYITSNIAPDSTFAIKHNLLIKDVDNDGKPEITDNIEIKYRKLPCCDHHFEYGIRQKKLVLHLINGKFESE